jgi:hypothetical protein
MAGRADQISQLPATLAIRVARRLRGRRIGLGQGFAAAKRNMSRDNWQQLSYALSA